jgi:hypothetical protein
VQPEASGLRLEPLGDEAPQPFGITTFDRSRFELTKRLVRRMGCYRWAQTAWLKRQHNLRFGSTEVKLKVPA